MSTSRKSERNNKHGNPWPQASAGHSGGDLGVVLNVLGDPIRSRWSHHSGYIYNRYIIYIYIILYIYHDISVVKGIHKPTYNSGHHIVCMYTQNAVLVFLTLLYTLSAGKIARHPWLFDFVSSRAKANGIGCCCILSLG